MQHLEISKARAGLMIDQPFFGSLAMNFRIEATGAIDTLSTDGTFLRYNPEFFRSLTEAERLYAVAHETMHAALLHCWRSGARDPELWNIAADFAINDVLKGAGFTLIKGALYDPKYHGLSAEQIYAMLQQQASGGGGKATDEQKQAAKLGNVEDAPQPKPKPEDGGKADKADDSMSEDDWKIAGKEATMAARKAGTVSGDTERAVANATASRADWRTILKEFVDHTMPSDYSWAHPNRRFISQGIYLPGIEKENLGALLIAVDTSGSITGGILDCFGENIRAILEEARPEVVHVVYCDSRVQHVQEFTPDDTLTLQPKGGGGTSFIPPFEWAKSKDLDVKAAIYLTDLEGSFPEDPQFPVLWATPLWVTALPPWGTVVRMEC